MRLQDKISMVTGAGTGIGEAIAHKFAREGARLLLNGLPDDPVRDVAAAVAGGGGQAEVYQEDVSEPAAAQACVDLAL
jgi:NAD(P)-dependent dehydrogenase (short-subunit alcohol dehydrogenase family)